MLADVNRKLTGIETILLITEPQYSAISSSVVRELLSYGKDVKDFLP
jgi:pantetheine-phosphate adenylyltransferase